jgi:DNA-binding HxlR family transcriptional regulator
LKIRNDNQLTLIVGPVTGSGERGGRAGAQTLSLFAIPTNVSLVTDLADGPLSLVNLRRRAGSPPQTTMRGHLRTLAKVGVVEKHRQGQFPRAVHYQLSAAGYELLAVAKVLAAWLTASPERPTALGSNAAKNAIKTLVEGWTTGMVRALSSRPLSLTELDRVIVAFSYPSLERRLSSMRLLGMVEAIPGSRRNTPYAVTAWLRGAIVPLVAAARWERQWLRETAAAITNRDVEAAFLLALPLLRLPADVSGTCRLAVRAGDARADGVAGVVARVQDGAIVSCVAGLDGSTDAWAFGRASGWCSAVIGGDASALELGGEPGLAAELVEELRCALSSPRSLQL